MVKDVSGETRAKKGEYQTKNGHIGTKTSKVWRDNPVLETGRRNAQLGRRGTKISENSTAASGPNIEETNMQGIIQTRGQTDRYGQIFTAPGFKKMGKFFKLLVSKRGKKKRLNPETRRETRT